MVTGVTTEWDDIQVKMGVYKPLEKGPTNDQIYEQSINELEYYDNKFVMNEKQIKEMAEDDIDFDDEDEFMKQYRARRIEQLKVESAKPKFGSVFEIVKADWEEHITRAPADVFVCIIFYQDQ